MTLLEDYGYLGTDAGQEFKNRIAASLYKEATTQLLNADPNATNYVAIMTFASVCLNAAADGVEHVAKAMVSQGLDNTTSDSALNTAIENNYEKLAGLYDPNLEL